MTADVMVVVPAYNEGRVIAATLSALVGRGFPVVVVDDGSKDDTAAVAAGFPVHVVRHPINLGAGAAVQTGLSYAVQRGAEFVVLCDADGQHDPAEVHDLIAPLRAGVADVVLGSRFLRAADMAAIPPVRRLVLRVSVWVNLLLTGVLLTDAHNGFRAFNRKAAAKINLEEDGFAHASELVYQVRKHGLRYVEHPTHVTYTDYSRAKGQSSWNGFNVVFDVLVGRVFR